MKKSAVNFDKQLAITEGSLLLCDSGGVMHAANFIKYEFTQYKLNFRSTIEVKLEERIVLS